MHDAYPNNITTSNLEVARKWELVITVSPLQGIVESVDYKPNTGARP